MLLDSPPRLLGSRFPRLLCAPGGDEALGQDIVEFCATFGVALDPWQQDVIRGSCSTDPAEYFTASEVGVMVPRQNGKGEILLARELGGLFLLEEDLVIHTAHEYRTAAEAFSRIQKVIEGNASLSRMCKIRIANGEQGVETKDGRRLRFMARTKGAGRGFTANCVILDEAYALTADQLEAIDYTMSAVPNHQVWYTTSAGLEDSVTLAAIRDRGIQGIDPDLYYAEWSADPRADLDDPEVWAQANPAFGTRITYKTVAAERRKHTEVGFGRERLGIWDDAGRLAVIPFDVWDGLIDRTSTPLDPVTFAVDVSPGRDAASIALSSRRADGRWHVELVESRIGNPTWIVDRLIQLTHKWDPTSVRLDSMAPVASLLPQLVEGGVPVETVSAAEYGRACGAFYDACLSGQLHHIDQPPLTAAVQAARQRPLGDAWAWHRKDTTADITPLVASTLALYGHAEHDAGMTTKFKGTPGKGRVIAFT